MGSWVFLFLAFLDLLVGFSLRIVIFPNAHKRNTYLSPPFIINPQPPTFVSSRAQNSLQTQNKQTTMSAIAINAPVPMSVDPMPAVPKSVIPFESTAVGALLRDDALLAQMSVASQRESVNREREREQALDMHDRVCRVMDMSGNALGKSITNAADVHNTIIEHETKIAELAKAKATVERLSAEIPRAKPWIQKLREIRHALPELRKFARKRKVESVRRSYAEEDAFERDAVVVKRRCAGGAWEEMKVPVRNNNHP